MEVVNVPIMVYHVGNVSSIIVEQFPRFQDVQWKKRKLGVGKNKECCKSIDNWSLVEVPSAQAPNQTSVYGVTNSVYYSSPIVQGYEHVEENDQEERVGSCQVVDDKELERIKFWAEAVRRKEVFKKPQIPDGVGNEIQLFKNASWFIYSVQRYRSISVNGKCSCQYLCKEDKAIGWTSCDINVKEKNNHQKYRHGNKLWQQIENPAVFSLVLGARDTVPISGVGHNAVVW